MKIFFLINPTRRDAGADQKMVGEFTKLLDESGHEHEIYLSKSPEDSDEAVCAAIERGYNWIWIGGGDGTLNQVLNCAFGKPVVFGIVPMGTVNALAKSLRMPIDPVQAVRYLLKAHAVPMDVGEVSGRYFFTYATVGLHAAVFHNIDTRLKKKWGSLAFWESAVRTLWKKSTLPRFLMEMEIADAPPGEHIERDYGYSFTISNMANYAGWATITKEDPASPGYFELHHFRRNRLMPMVIWFALLRLLGIEKSRPKSGQIYRRIRWVKVRSNKKLSLQIDGEPIKPEDRKNLRFECLNDAVQILLQEPEAGQLRGPVTPK